MYKRRQLLGTYLGLFLATLLPGVHAVDGPVWQGVGLGGVVFLVVNQMIQTYPSDIRRAPAVSLLMPAAIGVVQDSLIWLLFSWLSSQMHWGLHVDGLVTALLAGAVVRASVLALLPFGPQPAAEETA